MHTNCTIPKNYEIPIPTLIYKFVWVSFKKPECVAGSIIFGMNMGCCKKYHILIPTYKQKIVWPYFKQIDLIFPALVFAYELQSPSKLCNTNYYINLQICMTILQTASLCHWQHHFWHTNMATYESILYQFLLTITNLYDHILNRYIWYFQR